MNGPLVVSSLQKLLAVIDEVYSTFSHQPWWRGNADEAWTLVPGVHRVTGYGAGYEANIAMKFEQRARTRHANCPPSGDLARWLFLMQHYRLRTRFLDWTESPLVALYFATRDDEYRDRQGALWALDPYRLNEIQIGQAGILQPGHGDADKLINQAFTHTSAPDPKVLALLTHEVDLRMMVQVSAFTIHGSAAPLESRTDAAGYLRKFVVDAGAKAQIREHLERLAIRERNLFPDLEHLASDLNRDVY